MINIIKGGEIFEENYTSKHISFNVDDSSC